MRYNMLISLIIVLMFLVSCDKDMHWINANDPQADSAEIAKICEKAQAECGYIKTKADDGNFHSIFCGGCETGYICVGNKCYDIDECAYSSLNNCNNEVSTCANEEGSYSCICKENYSGDDCVPNTRTKECSGLPENAEWNTASSITQTWNGSEWEPANAGIYGEIGSTNECIFKCKENYNWNFGFSVCEAATQEADCSSKPNNTVWNDNGMNGKFTQEWDGDEWIPINYTSSYGMTAGVCKYKCEHGYTLNGSECKKIVALGNICTGQANCYDNNTEIPCPALNEDFYGQDAQHTNKCVVQSFTSSLDTVIDNNTGLIWEKSPSEEYYTWENRDIHCNNLNTIGYAGISNWRVPNPLELLTIVDNSTDNPATNSNFTGMPTDDSTYFWTSQEYNTNTDNAYSFSPSHGGYWYDRAKTNTYKILCVSGKELVPATTSDFVPLPDGKIVTDKRTGLMWQYGYETKKWHDGLAYCQGLNSDGYGGYTDWRLPNKNELASLLDPSKLGAPYSNFPLIPNGWFWSSSTRVSKTQNAWGLSMESSSVGMYHKNYDGIIKCVRSSDSYANQANPCLPNPCSGLANSTNVCMASGSGYVCGCKSGSEWNGSQCVVNPTNLPQCSPESATPCKDSSTSYIWSAKKYNKTWQEAIDYCETEVNEGGFTDWHLPNISELRTLIQNCSATITGGSCGVIDTGDLSTSCLASSCCSSCSCTNDPTGGLSKFGDLGYIWSSSTQSDDSSHAWRVDFLIAQPSICDKTVHNSVRCVRK